MTVSTMGWCQIGLELPRVAECGSLHEIEASANLVEIGLHP